MKEQNWVDTLRTSRRQRMSNSTLSLNCVNYSDLCFRSFLLALYCRVRYSAFFLGAKRKGVGSGGDCMCALWVGPCRLRPKRQSLASALPILQQ